MFQNSLFFQIGRSIQIIGCHFKLMTKLEEGNDFEESIQHNEDAHK
jgi:hypothetical protein